MLCLTPNIYLFLYILISICKMAYTTKLVMMIMGYTSWLIWKNEMKILR